MQALSWVAGVGVWFTVGFLLASTFGTMPARVRRQLYVSEHCSQLDVRLTTESIKRLKASGPLRVPLAEDAMKVDPTMICLDDSLVRVFIDDLPVVVIKGADLKASEPSSAPISPAPTVIAGR